MADKNEKSGYVYLNMHIFMALYGIQYNRMGANTSMDARFVVMAGIAEISVFFSGRVG